jgi:hypothetical protein
MMVRLFSLSSFKAGIVRYKTISLANIVNCSCKLGVERGDTCTDQADPRIQGRENKKNSRNGYKEGKELQQVCFMQNVNSFCMQCY